MSSTEPLNDVSGISVGERRERGSAEDGGGGGDVMDSDSLWLVGQAVQDPISEGGALVQEI